MDPQKVATHLPVSASSGAKQLEGQTTSASDGRPQSRLPALGFFWDIENCPIPRDRSAVDVAAMLRDKFLVDRREADFVCVCDGTKELVETVVEMNNAQITINHIPAVCKNAADDKLRTLIRKFADNHTRGDVVVLISGDINFAASLHDMRHTYGLYIIVIHPCKTNSGLLAQANEHYSFEELLEDVPVRSGVKDKNEFLNNVVLIDGLPLHKDYLAVMNKLKLLVSNTGGKVHQYRARETTAIIQFPNPDSTKRARARLQNESVFGSRISAEYHPSSEHAAYERRTNSGTVSNIHLSASFPSAQQLVRNPIGSPFQRLPIRYPPRAAAAGSGRFVSPYPWAHEAVPAGHAAHPSYSPLFTTPLTDAIGAQKSYRPQMPPTKILGKESVPFHQSQSFPSKSTFDPDRPVYVAPECYADDVLPDSLPSTSNGITHGGTLNSTFFSRMLSTKTAPVDVKPGRTAVNFEISPPETDETSLPDSIKKLKLNAVEDQNTPPKAKTFFVGALDQSVSRKSLKASLLNILNDLVPIVPDVTFVTTGGDVFAKIEFPDEIDSEFMISWLSKATLGSKPFSVLLNNPDNEPPTAVRLAVIHVFKSSNKLELPMFELFKLFQRRYDQDLELGTLRRMPDIVTVTEKKGKRIVKLLGTAVTWGREIEESRATERLDLGYCEKHCPKENVDQLFDTKSYRPLLCVKTNLKYFSKRVHQILIEHGGSLPLNTFVMCFEDQSAKLKEDPDNGAYLEHLLLSVPDVVITRNPDGPRKLVLLEGNDRKSLIVTGPAGQNPAAVQVLEQRISDLLLAQRRSALPITQFADAYNRMYGDECAAGGTNLENLIAAITKISTEFEVVGVGAERVVTLSFKAQKRRFTADLARIRALRPGKLISQKNITELYREIFGRPLVVMDYGVSDLDNLFDTPLEKGEPIEASKPEKKLNSKYSLEKFAADARTVLIACPGYRTELIPFANSYRIVAGHDLNLKDFGFQKLVDLIGALPDDLEVVMEGALRYVSLTVQRRAEHLREFIAEQLSYANGQDWLLLFEFKKCFELRYPNHPFTSMDYGCRNLEELSKLFPALVVVAPKTVRRRRKGKSNDTPDRKSTSAEQSQEEVAGISNAAPTNGLVERLDNGRDSDEKDIGAKPATPRRLAMSFG